jgi:hypothetical protein
MNRSILFILGIALVASSCNHKDYVEPVIESPVFTLRGYRNGEAFTLSAGENGLIQTASLERNKFGVMAWTSVFIDPSCQNCDPEFSITIHDSEGVDESDCQNLEIFSANELLFAQVASSSEFEECDLSLNGIEEAEQVNFIIPGSNAVSETSFSFDEEGDYELTADFVLELDGTSDENDIHIHQTIYAGAHRRLSAPFLYEMLHSNNTEQEIRLSAPNIAGIRFDHWEVNGVIEMSDELVREFSREAENRIKIVYIHDETGMEGSYSIRFNRGFPINEACNEDHHSMPAPSVNVDWQAGEPNYERAFITYRWQGKTYVSTTAMNSDAVLELLGYENYMAGIQGNEALQLNTKFSVKLVELGNESNVLELTDCNATFGFVKPF